jgi:hypothetical protein
LAGVVLDEGGWMIAVTIRWLSQHPSGGSGGELPRERTLAALTLRLSRARRCPRAVADEVVRSRVRADGSFRLPMRLAVAMSRRGKLDLALWRGAVSFAGNRLVRPNARFGELFMGRSVACVPGIGYLNPPRNGA